jgi:group I intron endonuclease
MTNKITNIYALIDPTNNEVRYVGKTINKLTYRLREHISVSKHNKTHKDRWINKLIRNNKIPEIKLLEQTYDWVNAERGFIRLFKSMGANLCNHTMGGEGIVGFKHSKEFKEKVSERIKKNPIYISPEERKILGEKHSKFLKENPEKSIFYRLNKDLDKMKAIRLKANKSSVEKNKKTVYVIDENKNILQKFESVAEVARHLQGNSSVIAAIARRNTNCGKKTKYKKLILVYEINEKEYVPKYNKGCSKKIKYINYKGEEFLYNSVTELLKAQDLKISLTTACRYAKLRKKYNNDYFEYVEQDV